MIDNRVVGRRIAALRQARGLTQLQLANIMNVSHQAVSKWESGAAMPDIQTLLDLANFFGMTVEQLLRPEDGEDPQADEAESEEEAPVEEAEAESSASEAKYMNVQQLLQMAPYMSKEAVAEIAMGMEEKLSASQIVRLAPYLTQDSLEKLIEKHHPEFTWDSLRKLAPHMRRQKVDELARAIARGEQTVKSSDDGFDRAISDIGRAIDDIGRGMDKAVRKALRFGENVFNEMSNAFGEMANEDGQTAKYRSEKAQELRHRAFERALEEEKWDWLGQHVEELDTDDALLQQIYARAEELGMWDWLREHGWNCVDESSVDAAIAGGNWDWLRDNYTEMTQQLRLRAACAAMDAGQWESFSADLDFAEEAAGLVSELWKRGKHMPAVELAKESEVEQTQFDALFREALAAEEWDVADALLPDVSPKCVGERTLDFAKAGQWERVQEFVACVPTEYMEQLMEVALEQSNFDAVDLLDAYL